MAEDVTISWQEYASLLEDREFLSALESAGVDNWEGYSLARRVYNGDSDEEDL